MNAMKIAHIPILLLSLVAILFAVSSFLEMREQEENFEEYITILTSLRGEVDANEVSIEELTSILAVFVEGNQELANQLALEQARRAELEVAAAENRQVFSEQILSLQSEVASQNLTPLISRWSSRVGRLKCTFDLGDKIGETNSSAVATVDAGRLFFITNDHAVTYNKINASKCEVTMLNGVTYDISGSDISRSQNSDIASLRTNVFGSGFTQLPKCNASSIETGDRVVILGYPSVGSDESITATEGIISGFDDGHYITSAKIERGNSGGAAIHVQGDCFVGLPTLVYVGSVESLARILPI